MVETGNQVPSLERAGQLFTRYTGTPVSEATVRRYVKRAGQVMPHLPAMKFVLEAGVEPGRLYSNVDGVNVPLVGGRWEEVRTLVIGEVSLVPDREPHCSQLSYSSRKTSAREFVQHAEIDVALHGLEQAEAICFGSDGATWCHRFPDRYCPEAARGMDFWHAAEHVVISLITGNHKA